MYTVLRFFFAEDAAADPAILREMGRRINEFRPGFFDGLSRDGGQFSGSISDSQEWSDHVDAMGAFLNAMSLAIREFPVHRVRGQFDVAVDDDDRRRDDTISSYLVPIELIRQMSDLGIAIMFSMYWFPAELSESNDEYA